MTCERTRELAAELALGIADGAERAQAMRHIAECADCRRELSELSEVVDGLVAIAPKREPPVGFESRVLGRLEQATWGPASGGPLATASPAAPRAPRWRRALAVLAPAAVAAAVAVFVVLGATSDDRRLADHYRDTLAEANGSYFDAARLRAPGDISAGVVYGYRGEPSWIFVAVDERYRSGSYTVELALTSGRRVPLPSLRLDAGTGGRAIPVDLYRVAAVRLIGSTRGDVLEARLR